MGISTIRLVDPLASAMQQRPSASAFRPSPLATASLSLAPREVAVLPGVSFLCSLVPGEGSTMELALATLCASCPRLLANRSVVEMQAGGQQREGNGCGTLHQSMCAIPPRPLFIAPPWQYLLHWFLLGAHCSLWPGDLLILIAPLEIFPLFCPHMRRPQWHRLHGCDPQRPSRCRHQRRQEPTRDALVQPPPELFPAGCREAACVPPCMGPYGSRVAGIEAGTGPTGML